MIVGDLPSFALRYGTNGIDIAWQYQGGLANGGETIEILGAYNARLLDFEYQDGRGWHLSADGPGHSLVPEARSLAGQPFGSLYYGRNWRPRMRSWAEALGPCGKKGVWWTTCRC